MRGRAANRDRPFEEKILIIARTTAARWFGLGRAVEDDDLVSAAYLGAWNHWLSYDATKGMALSSWLITGARRGVLDALRGADVLSRTERQKYRAALAADPRTPSPRVVVSLEDVMVEDPEGGSLTRIDCLGTEREDPEALIDQIAAEQIAAQIMQCFMPSQGHLAEVTRLVGMEGKTYRQVGTRLGLSESRISQLWKEAKALVQEALSP